MESLYIIMAFAASFLLLSIILPYLFRYQYNVNSRLEHIKGIYKDEGENIDIRKTPFYDRIIAPLVNKIKSSVQGAAPKQKRAELEAKLRSAGYPFGLRANGWIALRIICGIFLPVGLLFLIKSAAMPDTTKLMLVSVVGLIGIVYPNTMLRTRISIRQKNLLLQLPDTLDLLTISMEAGLSLDAAMDKVVEKSKGELAFEFEITLNEMKLGKTRRNALISMSQRCSVSEITSFISSVVQAEQMGVGIARVLRIQSAQARDKRKQRAREQAMKAPVKMMIPLVMFIFPTIFIVILGPAVIQIYNFLIKK
jgi:tight adherence protein C